MSAVAIDAVVLDPSINPRSGLDQPTVDRYVDAIAAGETLPPVKVERGSMRLLGGWHRHAAHLALGLAEIEAVEVDVPAGMTPKLYAAADNAEHGLPLVDGDARALAREMYDQAPDVTIAAVAKALHRPRKTVEGWVTDLAEDRRRQEEHSREVRRCLALMLKQLGWTQQRVAEVLGIDKGTMSRLVAGDVATNQLDESVLRDAVAAGPDDVADALEALAEQWREERIFARWTPDERDLLKRLRAGETVVVNMRDTAHARLWGWVEQSGLAVRIDRKSIWGNPFLLPDDGDRDTVCDAYADHYWPRKPSLHSRTAELRGKALGCWCAPQRCHGDFLAEQA